MPLIPSIDDAGKATERLQLTVAFLKRSPRETLVVFVALILIAIGFWLWSTGSSPPPFLVSEELWQHWAAPAGIASLALGVLAFAWVGWRFWRRLGPPPPEAVQVQPSAIKGPLAFGPQDGDLFLRLGRQIELGQLRGHILDDQVGLVVVRGESGAGKTSLLRAGLTQVLEDKDPPVACHYWESVPEKPAERLLAAIRQSWPDWENKPDLNSLDDLYATDALPGRHVVILDQFEQLDRHHADHQPIFALLKHILSEAPPPHHTTWIVAYRRAYDADWRDFEQDELTGHDQKERMLAIRLFREDQARDVMAVIADAAGFTLETALVDDLLATMRNEQGLISPVDIAITLLALNERAQAKPDKNVGKDDLALGGGATGLLADYIERQLDRYADDERSLIYAMLLELADLETDRRRPEGLGIDQLAAAIGRPPAMLRPYLQRLAAPNVRLLEALPTGAWRLPHERLIPALRRLSGQLLAEADQARRILDRGFAAWIASDRSRRRLLQGAELHTVLHHRRQLALGRNDGDKLAFIQASRRRQRQFRVAAGLALLLVAAGSYGAFDAKRDKEHRQDLAQWDLPRTLYDRQDELVSLTIDNSRLERLDWLSADLQHLTLRAPRLQDLQPLAALDGLTTLNLNLYSSSVDNFQPLAALDGLTTLNLDLSGSSVDNLQPLAALDGLTTLNLNLIGRRSVDNLQPLAGLDGLTTLSLDLRGSSVDDLQPLAALDGLTTLNLNLSGSSGANLQPLAALDGLTTLNLDLSGSSGANLQPLVRTPRSDGAEPHL